MEARADAGLAYMLQYEHVAWYEDGAVHILDRRVYPTKVEYKGKKLRTLPYDQLADALMEYIATL